MRRYVFPDGHELQCTHPVGVELLVHGEDRGKTIWRHGDNREAVMVVTPEMRKQWDQEGKPSVGQLSAWIEQVHEYQGGEHH